MNPRERMLAFAVLGILGLGLAGFFFNSFFWSPLEKSEDSIRSLRDQIEKKNQRVAEIQAELPKFERWRALTLPSKVDVANLEYDKWLTNTVQQSRFVNASVSPKAIDTKSGITATGAAAAKAAPVYTKLSFTVSGRATLANLVLFLEKFYNAGLLHQIRSISIQRPLTQVAQQQRNELDVTISIEALSLTGGDPRKTLLPVIDSRMLAIATVAAMRHIPVGFALAPDALGPRGELGPGKLASSERDYSQIARKDIFFGPQRSNEAPTNFVDASKYVRLTDITEDEEQTSKGPRRVRQANMIDLYNNRKIPLQADRSFSVREENYSVMFRGNVVKINDHDVIFQKVDSEGQPTKEGYYRIVVGGNMRDAIRRPLSRSELEREGLSPPTTGAKNKEAGEAEERH
jgi:hypothetical protein